MTARSRSAPAQKETPPRTSAAGASSGTEFSSSNAEYQEPKNSATDQVSKLRSSRKRSFNIAARMLGDFLRVVRLRYGEEFPDDDAGREDLHIALHLLANAIGPQPERLHQFAAERAPWLGADARSGLVARVLARPRRYSASTLGDLLMLGPGEREDLQITCIRPAGWSDAAMQAARRERQRAAASRRRRAKGVQTRLDFESQSTERAKPWLAAGVSRATWFRRHKAAADVETSPSPT